MSSILPQSTVDALRKYVETAVRIYGIECDLFVPANFSDIDLGNPYIKTQDWQYTQKKSRVYIEWAPSIPRLKKLGIFVEGEVPMIAWLSYQPDTCIGSYIRVPIQYVPRSVADTDEFDIVEPLVRGMHDAVVVSCFKITARRVKR